MQPQRSTALVLNHNRNPGIQNPEYLTYSITHQIKSIHVKENVNKQSFLFDVQCMLRYFERFLDVAFAEEKSDGNVYNSLVCTVSPS